MRFQAGGHELLNISIQNLGGKRKWENMSGKIIAFLDV
jgi:hypothetical protein